MARLYSSLKFLRFTDHLDALREQRVVAPVHVRIKPVNRCNHDCWYCAYRVDGLQLGEEMDETDALPEHKAYELVDDLIEMKVRAVTFSGGGEPLLYKPLGACVERLANAGVRVASLTNGSNLKGKVADAFAEHGTWVRVSVDGWDDASYAEARHIPLGAFTRLLENMRAFVARKSRCVLGVSYVTSQRNHEHVFEFCRMMRDIGVNHVKVAGSVVANDVASNNAYHRAIMARVTDELARAKELETPEFTVLNHYHEVEERFQKRYTTCPFLMFLTVIGADCAVYTCQDKAYSALGKLGSFRERRFRDFWFSEENRRKLFSFDPSVACPHHCVTHGKNLAILDYLSIDPEHGLFV